MSLKRREFLVSAGTVAGAGAVGTATAQENPTVQMVTEGSNYYFDPVGLFVEPGTTVTFENAAGSHNSVSYENRIPSAASTWSTTVGETADHTFEEPGTYDYYCQPHRTLGMVGRIVVGEPGGPADGSMPPDGEVPDSGTIVDEGSVSYEAFTSGGSGGGGGASAGASGSPLVGAGLFGSMTVAAGIVYLFANSEGESERVGSSVWKRRRGLQ